MIYGGWLNERDAHMPLAASSAARSCVGELCGVRLGQLWHKPGTAAPLSPVWPRYKGPSATVLYNMRQRWIPEGNETGSSTLLLPPLDPYEGARNHCCTGEEASRICRALSRAKSVFCCLHWGIFWLRQVCIYSISQHRHIDNDAVRTLTTLSASLFMFRLLLWWVWRGFFGWLANNYVIYLMSFHPSLWPLNFHL